MFKKNILRKLAIINLKQRPLRSFLAGLSITIGTACLLTFFGLSNGIKQATFEELERRSPLNQIVVTPEPEESNVISLFKGNSNKKISKEQITNIEKLSGVNKVYPEIQFNGFASAETSVLGMKLVTDTLVFGLPKQFLAKDSNTKTALEKTKEPYPTVIPRKILDLYNIAIATPQNLPHLKEENLIGKSLTLYPNFSTFFPFAGSKNEKVELEVVGFSDKVNLVGITLPTAVIEKLNAEFSETTEPNYLQLYVEVKDPSQTTKIAETIEEQGFKTDYYHKNLEEIEAKFTYLKFSLGIISFIILISSAIAIMSTFLATVSERTKEIGLFRSLGAKKSHIRSLILFEAAIVGFIGSIVGVILGLGLGSALNSYASSALSLSSFSSDNLFLISSLSIFATLVFGFIITIATAYLPARRAANTDPLIALKK